MIKWDIQTGIPGTPSNQAQRILYLQKLEIAVFIIFIYLSGRIYLPTYILYHTKDYILNRPHQELKNATKQQFFSLDTIKLTDKIENEVKGNYYVAVLFSNLKLKSYDSFLRYILLLAGDI